MEQKKYMVHIEIKQVYEVPIQCTNPVESFSEVINVIVVVVDLNDEPPTFSKSQYNLNVKEFTSVGDSVGNYPATDLDSSQLYYSLISEPDGQFGLQADTNANIVVRSILNYDVIKSVKLTLSGSDGGNSPTESMCPFAYSCFLQHRRGDHPQQRDQLSLVTLLKDTEVAGGTDSFSSTTTIMVSITDVDNRPPWFQPCSKIPVGQNTFCESSGYTGSVSLTVHELTALHLEPGPLYAVDGDTGINEVITYSILSGNTGNLFQINANSGNITMNRAADVDGPIILTVLATQSINSFQFSRTTVTIQVVPKSLHPPVFERERYSGFVSGLGSMVVDLSDKETPLMIRATDADYLGGVNPHIVYTVHGSSNFSLIEGYLFMIKDTPLGAVSLQSKGPIVLHLCHCNTWPVHYQVEARDTTFGTVITAEVQVEVTSGLPTTSVAPSTSAAPPTTDAAGGSGSGGYSLTDMAVLGATLAVLLVISLGIIGFLAYRVQKGKAAWGKLFEASVFRSALGRGPGGLKDGIQYTNEAFKNDDDSDSTGPASPTELSRKMSEQPAAIVATKAVTEEAISKYQATLLATLPEVEPSPAEADKEDKEVKPILTKERRTEEGYKSVWFKEDIVPDAKEDVHIIPDNGQQDAEEDEEGSSSSGNEEDIKPRRKVLFGDTDVDSGLGIKASDSEYNDRVTSHL
ncbi:Cadherin-related family member 5 [Merluccius polli]|uniref:Cadherin-related family member 5 n=1 Tax=Merluccius polli TaxID=89951 RepID=A0AA47P4L5_MERPO|nr:Cadherin-related family member 5 [Merluccius polli]